MRNNKNHRSAERGFSLIELMIVIAIIGILIAVGVTGWKAAVRSANESAAINHLKTIAVDQMLYYNAHQRSTYGTFDELLKEGQLDARFAGTTPLVEGYVYVMRVIPKSTTSQPGFAVNADPQVTEGVGATGRNHYYIDSNSNTIHVNTSQPAASTDPPIGQ